MCGIFGLVAAERDATPADTLRDTIRRLYLLSETRGKESAGLAAVAGDQIHILKQPIPASQFIKTRAYEQVMRDVTGNGSSATPVAIVGHSRLVTNGAQENNQNNQPVIAGAMAGVHNGIIVNVDELWAKYPQLRRQYEVDTEILLSLIRHFASEGASLVEATRGAFGEIEGCAAIGVLLADYDQVLLATNNGSLYLSQSEAGHACVFASEEYILKQLLNSNGLRERLGFGPIEAVAPKHARLISLETGDVVKFPLSPEGNGTAAIAARAAARPIVDHSHLLDGEVRSARTRAYSPAVHVDDRDDPELLLQHQDRLAKVQRCTRCILPASFTFIDFDEQGVCNYCRNHKPFTNDGHDALAEAVKKFRRADGKPECLVGVSGGRDSCYGLHYLERDLDLRTIAYTYDWGMVTDLARRNVSRMCARLGVEHILISADINQKRENIRKNVTAWLKQPDLGMVPLFMAGDKQFFYFANQLKKRTEIDLFMFCAGNQFETTDFKVGFCGVPSANARGILRVPMRDSFKLARYYGMRYLKNPRYLNSSIGDTLFAFFASYYMPHDYFYLYQYIPWHEDELMRTLQNEYDWEVADDTAATWRIGDGTAPFYNYIYHCVAGFSEMDTFRSHQVREGHITRDEALKRATAENQPRYESLKWYFNAIKLDIPFNDVIRTINSIPKRY